MVSDFSNKKRVKLEKIEPGEAPPLAPPLYPGQILENLYRIEEEIAKGGMGVIHLAQDQSTEQKVIIKSPHESFFYKEERKLLFLREAEEWVKLDPHQNIVKAYTVLNIDYLPRIVAEYVDGGTLSEYLSKGPLDPKTAIDIAAQICYGMSFAHQSGLAHRDLKPLNILVSKDGTIKVSDFGLSKKQEQAEIKPIDSKIPNPLRGALQSSVYGTPEYVAPEQWEGHATSLTDIYAFGVILYELFCHCRPFDFAHLGEPQRTAAYKEAHFKNAAPHPMELGSALPDLLSNLMISCMAKDPMDRPESFEEIILVLQLVSKNLGVQTLRPEPEATELDLHGKNDRGFAFLRLGHGNIIRTDYEKAEECYEKAKVIFEETQSKEGMANYFRGMGRVYYRSLKSDDAIRMYEKSMEIFEEIGDRKGVARCLLNLGANNGN